jgi:hypothetical protein
LWREWQNHSTRHPGWQTACQYPKLNQCKIAIGALETFRPGQVSGHALDPADLESRIVALERCLSEMECLVEQLQREQRDAQLETKRKAEAKKSLVLRSHLSTEAMPFP